MTLPVPRTKPPEERRAELLDAAQEIVAAGGASALTVDEVTSRAGLGKGTFYLHFKTKDDVLVALRDRLAREILAEHERALAEVDPDDHARRLDRWIADAIAGHVERAALQDALFHARGAARDPLGGAAAHVAMLRGILEAGTEAGAFAIEDPPTTAVLLYSAMHGAVHALLDQPGGDAPRLVAAMQALARRAVAPADEKAR